MQALEPVPDDEFQILYQNEQPLTESEAEPDSDTISGPSSSEYEPSQESSQSSFWSGSSQVDLPSSKCIIVVNAHLPSFSLNIKYFIF